MLEQEAKKDNICQEPNQNPISNSFITIVPEDCSRNNRIYNIPQSNEYIVEQYRIEGGSNDEGSGSQNALYSVSQHVTPVSTNYTICQSGNGTDGAYGVNGEWDRERTISCSETTKDTSSEVLSTDKQMTGIQNILLILKLGYVYVKSIFSMGSSLTGCTLLFREFFRLFSSLAFVLDVPFVLEMLSFLHINRFINVRKPLCHQA